MGAGDRPLLDRGPLIEVLGDKAAAERELRNGPPKFSGPGIRVGVWQNAGYGSAPILENLRAAPDISAAPLYNLRTESMAACNVVILTQPREKIILFKNKKIMDAVRAYVRGGGGVLATHALVGIRGFVPVAPEIATGNDRIPGNTWRAVSRHPVARGLTGEVYRSTFNDRIGIRLGKHGTAVVETPDGTPIAAAGKLGKGRYVACGLGIGIGKGDRDGNVSIAEKKLLLNAARWLAGK